ncbi:hypothetical protein PWT90_00389 [Aphanocladium album]|nr:hypothetical protein PWT90_00389 [Aphanocladium album]
MSMSGASGALSSSDVALAFARLRDDEPKKRLALLVTQAELLTEETRGNLEHDSMLLGDPSFLGGFDKPRAELMIRAVALLDLCAEMEEPNEENIRALISDIAEKPHFEYEKEVREALLRQAQHLEAKRMGWLHVQLVGAKGTYESSDKLTISWFKTSTRHGEDCLERLDLSEELRAAFQARSLSQVNQALLGLSQQNGELALLNVKAVS